MFYRIIKFFLIVSLLGLVGVGIYVYILLRSNPHPPTLNSHVSGREGVEVPSSDYSFPWLSNTEFKKEDFDYPSVELEISVAFVPKDSVSEKERVIVSNVGEDQLFCIRELLSDEKIQFSYRKSSDILDLILYVNKLDKDKILSLFDYYDIQYSFN